MGLSFVALSNDKKMSSLILSLKQIIEADLNEQDEESSTSRFLLKGLPLSVLDELLEELNSDTIGGYPLIVIKKDGSPKPNTSLRDSERIPLTDDIEEYYNREVKPHLPNSWMDRDKDKVGYEINFTKYFYQYKPLRSLHAITSDLLEFDSESEGIFKEIVNEEI